MSTDSTAIVRRYFAALDAHEYDVLAEVLAPTFVQERPDRTFDGREAFVHFMRDERPLTETSHELVYLLGADDRVAAHGRLLDADGSLVLEFADHFTLEDGLISRLDTFVR